MKTMLQKLTYHLSEHPLIVNFRWNHTHSWGSTWSFLFTSIALYLSVSVLLHLLLLLFLGRCNNRPVPLGPIPALHSLSMSVISAAEIRDTRWFWTRTKTTPLQWLLCFPLGTRPSGRVFFWSYMFYLSRFLHMFRTFLTVLRRRKLVFYQLFNHSIMTFMSFSWLEFSQSFQVVAILLTTSVYTVVYGYRFWTAVGLPSRCFNFVVHCQVVLLGCNLLCHIGVLSLHLVKGGCNGIGAWIFNSVLNCVILLLFINFYLKILQVDNRKSESSSSSSSSIVEEFCKIKEKDI